MSDYAVKLTNYGRVAIAHAETTGTPLVLSSIAVGDSVEVPTAENEALGHEVHRAVIFEAAVDALDPGLMRFTATISAEFGGFWIREVGVFDNTGGLVYVAAFPEEYKPLLPSAVAKECVINLLCTVGNAANVTVNIDPSSIAASRTYVGAVIASRFREPQDKGAVGDGVADDTQPIKDTLATQSGLREYKVAAYTNPYGRQSPKDGLVHNQQTGRVYNPLHHQDQLIFGVETLQHWWSKCKGDATKRNPTRSDKKIVMSGDSTTYGFADNPGYTPPELLAAYAKTRGYANVTVLNHGQSGHNTGTWDSDFVTVDIGANPDLLVLRWGANDGGLHTPQQFIDFLRSGLGKIRAARSVATLSIILMTPSSMNDVTSGRSEVWSERINAGIREAARDFQCCFIDTYAAFQNSHDGAGLWYDSIVYGGIGRSIHPLDELQQSIAGLIADVALPSGRPMDVLNAFRVYSTFESVDFGNVAMAPSDAQTGLTIHRTTKGSKANPTVYGSDRGAPYNGTIVTIKGQEDTVLQISIPLVDANGEPNAGISARGVSMRVGFSDEWSDWLGATYDLTAYGVSGWSVDQDAYAQTSIEGRVFLNGLIRKNSASVEDGTVIMTLPDSLRPRVDELFVVGGDISTQVRLRVDTSGNVKIYNFSGGGYISLGAISYKASTWAALPGAN